jgi:hypothetical protein
MLPGRDNGVAASDGGSPPVATIAANSTFSSASNASDPDRANRRHA